MIDQRTFSSVNNNIGWTLQREIQLLADDVSDLVLNSVNLEEKLLQFCARRLRVLQAGPCSGNKPCDYFQAPTITLAGCCSARFSSSRMMNTKVKFLIWTIQNERRRDGFKCQRLRLDTAARDSAPRGSHLFGGLLYLICPYPCWMF